MVSWDNKDIRWPAQLPDAGPRRIVSPFRNHYYLNVVTYGYTMPYWTWERWEKEIDWMALHGIDMPLALVATEGIAIRVWKERNRRILYRAGTPPLAADGEHRQS